MAMNARLVPWTIVGASLVVLGTLVVATPYLEASPAALTGESVEAQTMGQSWITGLALVAVGALVALVAMLRSETPR